MDILEIIKIKTRCSEDFTEFLKYCKIVEPPTQDNPGGVIDFQLWPHIKDVIKRLLTKKLIVILKSRQVGISWLLAAYSLWYTLFKYGGYVMLFSKGESEAIELLSKCKKIYNHLPDYLRLQGKGGDSLTELSFPSMASANKAFAATETGGISYSGSVIIDDEWLQHPYASRNYLQAKPCIDMGAQFIGVFTIDKTRMSEIAVQVFVDALSNKNGFDPYFIPYMARPGRDEEWYERTRNSIPDSDLMGLTPDLYMLSNYPRSIEEALRTIGAAAAFDHVSLDTMSDGAKTALSPDWYKANVPELDWNVIKIYQPFSFGQYYVSASDNSHGIGKDYSAFGIMNVKTGVIVADILRNDLPPSDFAYHIFQVEKYYHNPKFFPEDNDCGMVVIEKLQEMGFRSFGFQDEKRTKPGFHTGKNRDEVYTKLVPAINNLQITTPNVHGISQLRDLIRNIESGGRIEAAKGKHDDYPMMMAILWNKRNEVSTNEWEPTIISSLHFQGDSRRKEWNVLNRR
jgi:hypothetical protein